MSENTVRKYSQKIQSGNTVRKYSQKIQSENTVRKYSQKIQSRTIVWVIFIYVERQYTSIFKGVAKYFPV